MKFRNIRKQKCRSIGRICKHPKACEYFCDDYEFYVSVMTQARMEKQRAMEAQRNKAALDRALAPPFRTEVI